MSNKLRFPLDIQLFAEEGPETPSTTPSTQSNSTTVEIDYDKLASIVNKKSSTTEDKVLQGYFKSQGLNQDEVNEAIKTFKEQKAASETAKQQEYQTLQQENEKLKAQMLNASIDTKVTELASGMGVNAEKMPFLQKMVDRSKASKEDGTLNDEEIKKAIEEVLKAFPEFKGSSNTNNNQGGFQQIGSAGGSAGNQSGIDATLDAIFGIKK